MSPPPTAADAAATSAADAAAASAAVLDMKSGRSGGQVWVTDSLDNSPALA